MTERRCSSTGRTSTPSHESEGEPQIDPSPSEPAEGSVSWQGDSFTDDQPRVVLAKSSDSNSSADQTPSDEGPAMPWIIVLLALALLATVGVVGWLVGRNSPGGEGTDAGLDKAWRTDGSTDVDSSPSGDQPPGRSPPELLEQRGAGPAPARATRRPG